MLSEALDPEIPADQTYVGDEASTLRRQYVAENRKSVPPLPEHRCRNKGTVITLVLRIIVL